MYILNLLMDLSSSTIHYVVAIDMCTRVFEKFKIIGVDCSLVHMLFTDL